MTKTRIIPMDLNCHPFCGTKISTKLKLLIAFDIILSSILLNLTVIGIVFICAFNNRIISVPEGSTSLTSGSVLNITLTNLLLTSVFLVVTILLDIWLWILVPKKNKERLQAWFLIKLTMELCEAIGFGVEVALGHHSSLYIVFMLLNFLFTGFILWVVYTFGEEQAKSPKTILEGNKLVKFFRKSGSFKNSGEDEEAALRAVLED